MVFRSKLSVLKGGFFIISALLLYYHAATHSPDYIYSRAGSAHDHVDTSDAIPNYVHFVHIMPSSSPSGTDANLIFELRQFLSVYSALLHFAPDIIYIHTDASPAAVERARARANGTNTWAQKILALPAVAIRHVTAPATTTRGVAISRIEHRSDFVRTRAVCDRGGVYLDWDAYALRSVAALRNAGFANVVGRQKHGAVNSGCWMSRPGSALLREWVAEQHDAYTGGWTVHSNNLLSRLAERDADDGLLAGFLAGWRLARPRKKEVLILKRKAFAPSSWELVDAKALFEAHPGESVGDPSAKQDSRVQHQRRKFSWEIDYSESYVLHAFKAVANQKIENFDPEGITMKYVLARNSNFACAVYPAVKHAIDAGILSADD